MLHNRTIVVGAITTAALLVQGMAVRGRAQGRVDNVESSADRPPTAPTTAQGAGLVPPLGTMPDERASISWGETQRGEIQAGLKLANRYGSWDQHTGLYIFNVYIRNVTKRTLTVECPSFSGLTVPSDDTDYTTLVQSPLIFCTPRLRDDDDRKVNLSFRKGSDSAKFTLGPGQEELVSHWMLRTMKPQAKASNPKYTLVAFVERGRYHMDCSVNALLSASPGSARSHRSKLITGAVTFDVMQEDVSR